MFASKGGLYSKKEQEEFRKAPPKQEENARDRVLEDELRARASTMGIDLVRDFLSTSSSPSRRQSQLTDLHCVTFTGQSKRP